jgi:ABC-type transport system involved in multi-copper enzyme maturation permease subunit
LPLYPAVFTIHPALLAFYTTLYCIVLVTDAIFESSNTKTPLKINFMKRFFIMLALIGATVFTSSYAAATKTSPVVTQAFESSFHGAKEISWEQVGVLYKATFELDGKYHSAFYNNDGDLIAVTQNLSSTQLPKALQASLKNELKGSWITELFAVSIEGNDTYYVKLENANGFIMLKSAGAKKWAFYQKADK